jgi:predicted small metal-binding protein
MPTQEFACSECDFTIRSENEDELVKFVKEHAVDVHGLSMDEGDIRANATTV